MTGPPRRRGRPSQETQRHRRRIEVRYREAGGPEKVGFSGNISVTGMMLRTPRVHPPGTILQMELRFPQRSLMVSGRVVWAREGPMAWLQTGRIGMGIHFIDPPPELTELAKGFAAPTGTPKG